MSLAERLAQSDAENRSGLSQLSAAVCMAVNWTAGTATLNIGGGVVEVPMAGTAPIVGDRVWVGFLGNQPVCLGPVPKPPTATVKTAPSNGKTSVLGDDGQTYSVAYPVGVTPAVNDRVALDWRVPGGFISARLSSETAAATPAPPVVTEPTLHEATFNPTDSGSYRNGSWWTPEVWASDNNLGAFFYGGQVAGSIPDNAAIEEVRVYVEAYYTFGDRPNFGLHSSGSKDGAPNIRDSFPVPSGSGWKDLPRSFGDALKTGAAQGIGVNRGGYHKFRPAGVDNSGALYVRWRS